MQRARHVDVGRVVVKADEVDVAGSKIRALADPSTLAPERAVIEVAARRAALAPAQWASILDALRGAVARHHAAHADEFGPTAGEIAEALDPSVRPALAAAVRALLDAGTLARTGQVLHEPGRVIRLNPADAALWEELSGVLAGAGMDPPRLSFLAERLQAGEAPLRALAERLARIGWLHRARPSISCCRRWKRAWLIRPAVPRRRTTAC